MSTHPMNPVADTETRMKISAAINDFWRDNGYGPCVRDIAGKVDLTPSTIQYHLEIMHGHGTITRTPGVSRSIRVTDVA